jgi:serine/tyrosine/threonine adenylyltransferase
MIYHFPLENTYASLPDRFYARVPPTPVSAPKLIRLNRDLASDLRLDPDWLGSREGVEVLAGKRVPDRATPIAQAYAGHQFGHFVPQLGDGRAILLGEVVDVQGVRRDIQLKGSGPTPFSRRGDGRAALGPVLREYIVSEAMAALGIPTTRTLATVSTGELVARDKLLPGAVLARVASSHIRVGTFQFFAARGDQEGVRLLADHVIARHYPQAGSAARPYRALLDEVIARQADLIAAWLLVGFIHGVMNTDNTSIAGETIDYGPCAFMDSYNPGTVFSSIDHQGRYAYGNQPRIAVWNLTRLAETLLPLLSETEEKAIAEAEEALAAFAPRFDATLHAGFRRKLGLLKNRDSDVELVQDLLNLMAESQADFTLTFRRLSDAAEERGSDELVRQLFVTSTGFDEWMVRWRKRLEHEPQDSTVRSATMRAVNPAYIPRNHRIEAMIEAAVGREDFAPFNELLEGLSTPFVDQARYAHYARPPEPHERVNQTFCGT